MRKSSKKDRLHHKKQRPPEGGLASCLRRNRGGLFPLLLQGDVSPPIPGPPNLVFPLGPLLAVAHGCQPAGRYTSLPKGQRNGVRPALAQGHVPFYCPPLIAVPVDHHVSGGCQQKLDVGVQGPPLIPTDVRPIKVKENSHAPRGRERHRVVLLSSLGSLWGVCRRGRLDDLPRRS